MLGNRFPVVAGQVDVGKLPGQFDVRRDAFNSSCSI